MKLITENSVYELGSTRLMTDDGLDEIWITLTKIKELRPSSAFTVGQVLRGKHITWGIGTRCLLYSTQVPKMGSLVISTSWIMDMEP